MKFPQHLKIKPRAVDLSHGKKACLLCVLVLLAATLVACGGGGGGGGSSGLRGIMSPVTTQSNDMCLARQWWEWTEDPHNPSQEYRDPVVTQGPDGVPCPNQERQAAGTSGTTLYEFGCGRSSTIVSGGPRNCDDSYPGGEEINDLDSKLDADGNPIMVTIYVIDYRDPTEMDPEEHGRLVSTVLQNNINSDSADVDLRYTDDFEQILASYNIPAEGSLMSFSIDPILRRGTADRIIRMNLYVVRAAGNIPLILNPMYQDYQNVLCAGGNTRGCDDMEDFEKLGSSGRLVIAAGLRGDGMGLHARSIPCGIAADFCILAYYEVRTSGIGGTFSGGGTSFSTPLVASAISEVSRVFGINIGHSMEVVLAVARQIPNCAKEICGRGALDLTKLFNNQGEILACLTNVDTIACSSTSQASVSKGLLALPGLDENTEVLAMNEHVGVPFNLVTQASSLGLLKSAPDMDLHGYGNGFAMSSDSMAVCRQDLCAFASELGLFGLRHSFAANSFCYAAHRRDSEFFGGYGTGSLAFGPSDYAHFGCAARRALGNRVELDASVDVAYAKARDGAVVKDLQGVLASPAIGLSRETKTTQGGESKLSLRMSYDRFSGSFNANSRDRRLKASQAEVDLTWEYSF